MCGHSYNAEHRAEKPKPCHQICGTCNHTYDLWIRRRELKHSFASFDCWLLHTLAREISRAKKHGAVVFLPCKARYTGGEKCCAPAWDDERHLCVVHRDEADDSVRSQWDINEEKAWAIVKKQWRLIEAWDRSKKTREKPPIPESQFDVMRRLQKETEETKRRSKRKIFNHRVRKWD